jgi:hypothetical protein
MSLQEHNADSIIQRMDLTKGEHIVAVYKRTESQYYSAREEPKSTTEAREAHIRRLHALVTVPSGSSALTQSELPQSIRELKIDVPQVDTCVVVTNKAAYEIKLR